MGGPSLVGVTGNAMDVARGMLDNRLYLDITEGTREAARRVVAARARDAADLHLLLRSLGLLPRPLSDTPATRAEARDATPPGD